MFTAVDHILEARSSPTDAYRVITLSFELGVSHGAVAALDVLDSAKAYVSHEHGAFASRLQLRLASSLREVNGPAC